MSFNLIDSIKNSLILIALVLGFSSNLFAQTVKGTIVSDADDLPIPFVSIAISDTGVGTVTDLDGRYVINLPFDYKGEIWIRHVGHVSLTISAQQLRESSDIVLESNVNELDEVIFTAKENPAYAIIRKVIDNRKLHDPEKLESYCFKSYAKEIYRLDPNQAMTDSVLKTLNEKDKKDWKRQDKKQYTLESNVETSYLFIAESVAEERFIQPGMRNEEVLATKVSGFNNGLLAATGSSYQPLGFYDDVITILGLEYISPIRPGALLQYEFYIEDTTMYQQDTVYVISFVPKKNRKFEALKGTMEVSMNGYALKNVKAETANVKSKIGVKIEQNYELVEGKWFPVFQYSNFVLQDIDYFGHQIILENNRHISDIDFEPNLLREDFSDVSLNIQRVKESESLALIEAHRPIDLDTMELRTFERLDSMTAKLKPIETLVEAVFTQRLDLGKVDLRMNNLFSYNRYEQVRLGAGFETNQYFSDKLRIGGYVGYGIGDGAWKYGGDIRYEFDERNSTFVQFKYFNDLHEVGRVEFFEKTTIGISDLIRSWQGSQFDQVETYRFTLNSRIAPFVYAQFNTTLTALDPTYAYNYTSPEFSASSFQVNDMSLSLRYAKNERYIDVYGRKVSTGYDYPAIQLMFTHGNSTWLQGDFDYNRLDLQVEYQKKFFLGKSYFVLKGAYIKGELPYGLLVTGLGNKDSFFGVWGFYQTMNRYEFLADQDLSLFYKHNFGNFLMNNKFMKPELVLFQNSGIGNLSDASVHEEVVFRPMNKGYFESGLGLKNLIRLNYFDVAYFTFGVEAYYRYGYYSYSNPEDNLALKINLSFSL
ncbi:MAG: DUF5686 and carboxypeptidase regulatory-like domain-containing protein [Reichenbachiella sp.]